MPRKTKNSILCDLIRDTYADSVIIGLSDYMSADLGIYDELLHSILINLVSFHVTNGKTYECYHITEILHFAEELADIFKIDRTVSLKILISPLYDDVDLSDEELSFIKYLIDAEYYEAAVPDIERDIKEGKLNISSLADVISALTEKAVINFSGNTAYLVTGIKVS